MSIRLLSSPIAITLLTAASIANADPPHYSLTVLSPPGWTGDGVQSTDGINNRGQVLLEAGVPYVYTNGSYAPVPPIPGGTLGNLMVSDINDQGQVVGQDVVNGQIHAFISTNGTTTDLGVGSGSDAGGVNNSGQVVGIVNNRAFLYSGNTLTVLPTLGGDQGQAFKINDAGVIVGASNLTTGGGFHPALFSDGMVSDLGLLPGFITGKAASINQSGVIVGYLSPNANTFPPGDHAFVYRNGVMTDLGLPAGRTSAIATSINNLDEIVGGLDNVGHGGFVYTNGQMYDLQQLIPQGTPGQIAFASAINDAGQIVVDALDTSRPQIPTERTLLLTPVPEPLIAAPLVGLVLLLRVRRRTSTN